MEERTYCSKSRRGTIRRANCSGILWKTGIKIALYFFSLTLRLSCNDIESLISFIVQSYITLGVAVGGIHEFQDLIMSGEYVKPWRNVEAKVYY